MTARNARRSGRRRTGRSIHVALIPAGLREMGLLRMIAFVWFGSTIAEEVFVRGLIQGWMQPDPPTPQPDVADHAESNSMMWNILLTPFPMAGSVTFRIPHRAIPRRRYASDGDLATMLALERWRELPLRLEPRRSN